MMAYLTLYNVFTQLLCVPEPKFFAPDYRHVRHGYYDPWKKSSIFIIICNHCLAFLHVRGLNRLTTAKVFP